MPNKYRLEIIDNESVIDTIIDSSKESLYKQYKEKCPEKCNITYNKFKTLLRQVTEENQLNTENFICKIEILNPKKNSQMVKETRKKHKKYEKYLLEVLNKNNIEYTQFREFE